MVQIQDKIKRICLYKYGLIICFLTVAMSQVKCRDEVNFKTACFPVRIESCEKSGAGVACDYSSQTTENVIMNLKCPTDHTVEIISADYSMPAVLENYCVNKDKSTKCSRVYPCPCCTKPSPVCLLSYTRENLTSLFRSCQNTVNSCTLIVPNINFTSINCPSFKRSHPDITCDSHPKLCGSRWIDVKYRCLPPEQGNNTHLTCPLSVGSNPTTLPVIGDDNWANFQVNFSFPCNGSIKGIQYRQIAPLKPVYIGIWHTTTGGSLLLKHKVKLLSNTLNSGLMHKVFEPALEVTSGDFVGIHHTGIYPHSVLSHDTNHDSQIYQTLVVEVFDEDMKEGKELSLSGRRTKLLNKAFAIQFQIGLQTVGHSTNLTRVNAMKENGRTVIGVIVAVTFAVALAITIITVISLRMVKRKWEKSRPVVVELDDGTYLDTSTINPYYQSTSRQVAVRENNGYLPPLKQPVFPLHTSGAYDEVTGSEPPENRSTLQYEDVTQGTSSHPLLQSNHQDFKDSSRGSERASNRSSLQYEDVAQGINNKPLSQSNHQESESPKKYLSILDENVPEVEGEHIEESVRSTEESTQQENNNYEKTANVTTNHYYKGLY